MNISGLWASGNNMSLAIHKIAGGGIIGTLHYLSAEYDINESFKIILLVNNSHGNIFYGFIKIHKGPEYIYLIKGKTNNQTPNLKLTFIRYLKRLHSKKEFFKININLHKIS